MFNRCSAIPFEVDKTGKSVSAVPSIDESLSDDPTSTATKPTNQSEESSPFSNLSL